MYIRVHGIRCSCLLRDRAELENCCRWFHTLHALKNILYNADSEQRDSGGCVLGAYVKYNVSLWLHCISYIVIGHRHTVILWIVSESHRRLPSCRGGEGRAVLRARGKGGGKRRSPVLIVL